MTSTSQGGTFVVLVGDGFDTTTRRLETRSIEAVVVSDRGSSFCIVVLAVVVVVVLSAGVVIDVVVNFLYQEIWYKSSINATHTGMTMRLDS
jgi:hypothetical protein